jgi:hypothetical protein
MRLRIIIRGSLLRLSGYAGQAGFSAVAGLKSGQFNRKRDPKKANIESSYGGQVSKDGIATLVLFYKIVRKLGAPIKL